MFSRICAVIALATSLGIATANAQTPEEFYAGRTIQFFVGTAPGSGGDQYNRLIAQHIGRHIPGNPNIIAQNMPEASGLGLMNWMYQAAARDGTVVGLPRTVTPYEPLVLGPQSQAAWDDILEYSWLGSPNSFPDVAVAWHTANVKTAEDLFEHELIVGGTGSLGSANDAYFLRNLLGFRYVLIPGYEGPGAVDLAMESGEVEARSSAGWTGLRTRGAEWLQNGWVNILYQNGAVADPAVPDDVPVLIDFATTDEQRQLIELKYSSNEVGFPYAVPPGVPQDRVDALRQAFLDLWEDEAFLAAAAAQGLDIYPVSWERMEEIYGNAYAAPQELWDHIAELSLPPEL